MHIIQIETCIYTVKTQITNDCVFFRHLLIKNIINNKLNNYYFLKVRFYYFLQFIRTLIFTLYRNMEKKEFSILLSPGIEAGIMFIPSTERRFNLNHHSTEKTNSQTGNRTWRCRTAKRAISR